MAKGAGHTLLILRHAHRSLSHPGLDNGLSAKGREQARLILKLFKSFFGRPSNTLLLSSPKKRCLETLRPIAKLTGVRMGTDDRLLEQRPAETHNQFEDRVRRFINEQRKAASPLTVVCSHGDWVPVALRLATGGRMRLKKGGWAQVEFEKGAAPRLSWLLQKLD
ncbi:MAG: histidine phosphatase family protein [Elusimicrobia bacterium]|nr:histidine phosphatase family protein [Elusimicrobiota bacterium]